MRYIRLRGALTAFLHLARLCAVLVFLLSTTELVAAQNTELGSARTAGEVTTEHGLYALCPPTGKGPASVCPLYLQHYFSSRFDSIKRLIDGLDARKDQARDWAKADRRWLIGMQWGLAALGAIATLMISLNNLGGVDLRRWAIVPTAAVGFLASLSGFYDFEQSHKNNLRAQSLYAGMLETLQVDLISAVEAGEPDRISDYDLEFYRRYLNESVETAMREFLELTADRAEAQRKTIKANTPPN